jgi:hypothetical protein
VEKVQRRASARKYLEDVKLAIADVQYMQEKLNRADEKSDKINIKAVYLALAGMDAALSREQRSQFSEVLDSPFVQVGAGAPPSPCHTHSPQPVLALRRLLGPAAAPACT